MSNPAAKPFPNAPVLDILANFSPTPSAVDPIVATLANGAPKAAIGAIAGKDPMTS